MTHRKVHSCCRRLAGERARSRRGVLLLIVLSLLVLFALIGVTFVVVAQQYTEAAKASAEYELKGDRPEQELDDALMMLLRGSSDPNSPLYSHSLLEDLYGTDGFRGAIVANLNPAINATPQAVQFRRIRFQDISLTARPSPNYYSGSVLTLLDSQGFPTRHSTRILRYIPPTPSGPQLLGELFFEPFEDLPQGVLLTMGTQFLVNGRPLNGPGRGAMPATTGDLTGPAVSPPPFGLNDPSAFPLALQPFRTNQPLPLTLSPPIFATDGDESWDAADYQNVFLARLPAQLPPMTGPRVPSANDPLIPSLHRPYLINYLLHRMDAEGWNWGSASPAMRQAIGLLSRATARPLPHHHPMFTGSNPAYAANLDGDLFPDAMDVDYGRGDNDLAMSDPNGDGVLDIPLIRGPWDVDNDLDGIADSVWVDLGAPVKSTRDGRLYKPLFAILCLDLDGRLNVNAHGSRERLNVVDSLGPDQASAVAPPRATLGQGYGPADINLQSGLTSTLDPFPPQTSRQLFAGILTERYQPRSGQPSNQLGDWLLLDPMMAPGQTAQNGNDPDLLRYPGHLFGLPGQYADFAFNRNNSVANLYASPPDLSAVGAIYLDHRGHPRYVRNQDPPTTMGGNYQWSPNVPFLPGSSITSSERLDNPYQLDLVYNLGGADSPFGEDDLEFLLRHRDQDARQFDTRLRTVFDVFLPASDPLNQPLQLLPDDLRNRLTTRSFDIPILSAGTWDDEERREMTVETVNRMNALRTAVNGAPLAQDPVSQTLTGISLVDLASKRLRDNWTDITDQQLDRQLRLLLPPEIRDGRRFDLNRLFSNGLDDNNNNVIDEPAEGPEAFRMNPDGPVTPHQATALASDPNFSTANNQDSPMFARQQYARYLYCLAILALDRNFVITDTGNLMTDREITRRRIAQWAINVVDFRDQDAVMTPFEYDVDPFDEDGWSIDDNYGTNDTGDRRIVWGCEAPELLISETLAFHDRRVADRGTGEMARFPNENSDDDMMNDILEPDNDLDQVMIPEGSLFMELYAAGAKAAENNPVRPAELYTNGQLDLSRMVEGSPVWRVAIAQPPEDIERTQDEDARLASAQDDSIWEENVSALFKPQYVNMVDPDSTEFVVSLLNEIGMTAGFRTDGVPNIPIYDRYFVFSTMRPSQVPDDPRKYYYNRTNQALITPGDYVVVGPRQQTSIGRNSTDITQPGTQRIDLQTNNLRHTGQGTAYWNLASLQSTAASRSTPVNFVLAADRPWGPQGMNISEPTPISQFAYPEPEDPNGTYASAADTPLDARGPLGQQSLDGSPVDPQTSDPKLTRNMTGTHEAFRVALLQRLADPTRPWSDGSNAPPNPYITVDSQLIDITVFNSLERRGPPTDWEDEQRNPLAAEPYDIWDPQDPQFQIELNFASRERGRTAERQMTGGPNIWSPLSTSPNHPERAGHATLVANQTGGNPVMLGAPDGTLQAENYFAHRALHTLGTLNYGPYGPPKTLASLPAEYRGSPLRPFPWYTWNDRPYVSNLELTLVPSSAPWRMLYEMRQFPDSNPNDFEQFHAPFAHLINFRYARDNSTEPTPNLVNLFDWTEVPSRFVNTQKMLAPPTQADLHPRLQEYSAPQNFISRFREPGKININTMVDQQVWAAIDPDQTTTFAEIQESLRGKAQSNYQGRPAFYSNPVRAAASADLMPLDSLKPDALADATLWRRKPGASNAGVEDLLFEFDQPGVSAIDTNRHPYFRYHKLNRLGNLLTSHSNVFAVWITVGYFEVHSWNAIDPFNTTLPRQYDLAHPDGYQLGLELGSTTGDIERHRAFYLIDRSIPVAFERGQDHNVENAILLRRIIE